MLPLAEIMCFENVEQTINDISCKKHKLKYLDQLDKIKNISEKQNYLGYTPRANTIRFLVQSIP